MKKKTQNTPSVLGGALLGGLSTATYNAIIQLIKPLINPDESDSKLVQPSSGGTILPSSPRLLELKPTGLGDVYALPSKNKITIGRVGVGLHKPDVALNVPAVVSRKHIEISKEKNSAISFTLTPIATEGNVTTVNGRVIPSGESVPIKDGDIIGLSSDGYYFIFRCTDIPLHTLPLFTKTDEFLGV